MLQRLLTIILMAGFIYGQDQGSGRHDITEWAAKTGLPPSTVHRLWRSASHFADEKDDDSHIVLLDVHALSSRNQWLMVVSAGIPSCLTLTVFSKTAGNPKVWSESDTPEKTGFCEHLGFAPEVTVANGKIVIEVPGDMISEGASHAEVFHYVYTWTGSSYLFADKEDSLRFVPAADRPTKRPE